jgi:hypothetical protein
MIGDPGENVGEPGLRIDVVELGGPDEGVHQGCAVGPALRSGELSAAPKMGAGVYAKSAAAKSNKRSKVVMLAIANLSFPVNMLDTPVLEVDHPSRRKG